MYKMEGCGVKPKAESGSCWRSQQQELRGKRPPSSPVNFPPHYSLPLPHRNNSCHQHSKPKFPRHDAPVAPICKVVQFSNPVFVEVGIQGFASLVQEMTGKGSGGGRRKRSRRPPLESSPARNQTAERTIIHPTIGSATTTSAGVALNDGSSCGLHGMHMAPISSTHDIDGAATTAAEGCAGGDDDWMAQATEAAATEISGGTAEDDIEDDYEKKLQLLQSYELGGASALAGGRCARAPPFMSDIDSFFSTLLSYAATPIDFW